MTKTYVKYAVFSFTKSGKLVDTESNMTYTEMKSWVQNEIWTGLKTVVVDIIVNKESESVHINRFTDEQQLKLFKD